MVSSWNNNYWISVFIVTHLVICKCHSCNSSHPSVKLSSNCQKWNTVIGSWVMNFFGYICSPSESSFSRLKILVNPCCDAGTSKRMSSIEYLLRFQSSFGEIFSHRINIVSDTDWNGLFIYNMRNSNP